MIDLSDDIEVEPPQPTTATVEAQTTRIPHQRAQPEGESAERMALENALNKLKQDGRSKVEIHVLPPGSSLMQLAAEME